MGRICKNLLAYLKYSCGVYTLIFIILLSLIQSLLNLSVSEWIKHWVSHTHYEQLEPSYRFSFLAIVFGFILTSVTSSFIISSIFLLQAKRLHSHMLESVVRTHISFFDSNPVGRVLSRFSKDISVADIVMPVGMV